MEKIFDFLHKIEKLKSTLRFSGRAIKGRPESSAEHSWRLTLMVFVFAEELKLDLDVNHAVRMAIVHDLAEAITGDIDALDIYDGKVSKEEKEKMEIAAMDELRDTLPDGLGSDIYGLWQEYVEGETREARFVKALDKIETLTQVYEAGHEFYIRPDFIPNYADQAVKKFPELIESLMIVKRKLKTEYAKGGLEWKDGYDEIIQTVYSHTTI
ncbi:MAG: HD domain-containing protein [Candidatus Moranbacteria bacterium]|nr:HD domain-containing protein [Candidatus Moranbacteria bacterium]